MFSAAAPAPALTTTSLRQTRRRLSLVSDNKLIEGLSALGIKEVEATRASAQPLPHSYARFCGVSRKGYAAYNPRKRNQDSILMEEHSATGSLLLGVFDGHGEAGDLVSRFFSDRLPLALYKNAKFAADPSAALVEELDRIEQLLLSGAWRAGGGAPRWAACARLSPTRPPPNLHTHPPPCLCTAPSSLRRVH